MDTTSPPTDIAPASSLTEALTDVLVVGATGSIGALVVAEALRRGLRTRALVRDEHRAASLPAGAVPVVGEFTDVATLTEAVDGVDAVVFTHVSHGGAAAAEAVDYGAVRNVLTALGGRPARLALMTAIGVTRHTPGHDWKRRGERLVRTSGRPYTIVRPGWFDANDDDQHAIVLLQGDRRWAGDPSDGVIARQQIAQVLVAALTCPTAAGTTFELVAQRGPAPTDVEHLFSALHHDVDGALDGVQDTDNMPLAAEPARVRADLEALSGLPR